MTNPYDGALPLPAEAAGIRALTGSLRDTDTTGPLCRQLLLRRAAYADRTHLRHPDLPENDYLNQALKLADYDRQHFTWSPDVPGPDSNAWAGDDGPLEYVRAQWNAAQQNLNKATGIQA